MVSDEQALACSRPARKATGSGRQDDPVTGQMLDSAGIDRDMALLSGVAGRIRLYSSRGDMAKIPAIAENMVLPLPPGLGWTKT